MKKIEKKRYLTKSAALATLLLFTLFLITSCTGNTGQTLDVEEASDTTDSQNEDNIEGTEDEDTSQEPEVAKDKFVVTLFKSDRKSNIDATYNEKTEQFTLNYADLDVIVFEIKEKYGISSLEKVRDLIEVEGMSYQEYKDFLNPSKKVYIEKPTLIQVELQDSQNQAAIEVLFSSGEIETFTYQTTNQAEISFDLGQKYSMSLDEIYRVISYYDEGEAKESINDIAGRLDQGLKVLVEKESGTLREISCDYFNHVIQFKFVLEGENETSILYHDISGTYNDKKVLRFKLNSQDLKSPNCVDETGSSTREFKSGMLYTCTNQGSGVVWMGEFDKYKDKDDWLGVQQTGRSSDQIKFKCI